VTGADPERGGTLVLVAALAVAAALCVAFFPLRADDAYIVGRYANNIVAGRGFVFNEGERINALTSPLHLFTLVVLRPWVGDVVTTYRVLAALAAAAAIVAVAVSRWGGGARTALFAALVLASPFMSFWLVGGLETPVLAALCFGLASLVLAEGFDHSERRQCAAIVLATLVVFTRYDAVLFAAPVALAILIRHGNSLRVRITLAACAIAFGGWVVFTFLYFGDILPTSFYVKAGNVPSVSEIGRGVLYLASFSVLSLLWVPALLGRRPARNVARVPTAYMRAVYIGLALTLAYGLVASTKHMMYLYRLLVAFLPVAGLLVVDRLPAARARAFAWVAVGLVAVQVALGVFIYSQSENPTLSLLVEGRSEDSERFELSHVGARHTADFLAAVATQADAVAMHWKVHGRDAQRPPRILVNTGGMLPYLLPSAYVLETLVTYRHHCKPDLDLLADYVQVIYRGEQVAAIEAELLRRGQDRVARETIRVDGFTPHPYDVNVDLWYRRSNAPNPLPAKIGDPCKF